MNILVVEDDGIKFRMVESFLKESQPKSEVLRAASYQSGLEALLTETYDVVILDMSLPNSDINQGSVGMNVYTFGGQDILREMQRKRVMVKAIVLTQYTTFFRDDVEVPFEQLKAELMQKYPKSLLGCVRLDNTSVGWKHELAELLKNENFDH